MKILQDSGSIFTTLMNNTPAIDVCNVVGSVLMAKARDVFGTENQLGSKKSGPILINRSNMGNVEC
jgi:hypothetical protein